MASGIGLCGSESAQQGGTSACEKPPREVIGWIKSLTYATERLQALHQELAARLTPVLAPAPPESDGNKTEQASCGLASAIQSEVLRLNDLESRISDTLRRLEI